jgi:hypothetical protein
MNINKLFKQKALYWGNPVQNGYGGYTFDLPLVLAVRWEDIANDFIDSEGVHTVSNSIVYVTQDVVTGGYFSLLDSEEAEELWLLSQNGIRNLTASEAAQYSTPFNSGVVSFKIKQFSKIPGIRADKFLRKAWL